MRPGMCLANLLLVSITMCAIIITVDNLEYLFWILFSLMARFLEMESLG